MNCEGGNPSSSNVHSAGDSSVDVSSEGGYPSLMSHNEEQDDLVDEYDKDKIRNKVGRAYKKRSKK